MGGLREETIDQKAESGRPARRTSLTGGDVIDPEAGVPLSKAAPTAPALPDAALPDAGPALSPARALLAAVFAAPLGGHGPPPGLGGQRVRTHEPESGPDFHLHVDDEGLKVAIPKADWWSAWRRLQNLDRFVYLDPKNYTLLTIVSYLADDGAGGDEVKLAINVAPCKPSYSKAFKQLDHSTGK